MLTARLACLDNQAHEHAHDYHQLVLSLSGRAEFEVDGCGGEVCRMRACLVPGDAEIAWPKLRALLGVSRLSLPDAATARKVTGYERGTITPFGASRAWPVIADASVTGRRVSIGGGAHGVAIAVDADAMLAALDATVADIT